MVVQINNNLRLARKYVISPRTLYVPRNDHFSENVARGKLWALKNR